MRTRRLVLPAVLVLILLALAAAAAAWWWVKRDGRYDQPPNAVEAVTIRRFASNPLVTPASSPTIGQLIAGPSVIRVPDWIENPLGRYYMYFAHHGGAYIRLAYADRVEGPWRIHEPGTLKLSQIPHFHGHVASPDVQVDHAERRIRMYFHGEVEGVEVGQYTGAAVSRDGLSFEPIDGILGTYAFRVFEHGGYHYAVGKAPGTEGGRLLRSSHPLRTFEDRGLFIPYLRRSAVLERGGRLLVFYSRIGDAPEGILVSSVDLTDDWRRWRPSEPLEVINCEGGEFPIEASSRGRDVNVRQLRDPHVFEDEGRTYLFYSIAGEMGIAGAELDITMRDEVRTSQR